VSRTSNFHIASRVLALCQQPRTVAEIEQDFGESERHLARYAVYNLVKRRLLRNINPGQHGWGKRGRFVVAGADGEALTTTRPVSDGGLALARAWGLPC
jgi:hypothetical protein